MRRTIMNTVLATTQPRLSRRIMAWAALALALCLNSAWGQRPSISGLQQQLDTVGNALVVCPPGASTRFVDNGDGTICDHQTGLMWEKKDAADGALDYTNPRDVDNWYGWACCVGGTDPDGNVFTDFLARLNGEVASTGPSEQLGGYSDWRLPTSAELQTIVDCSFGVPCIDPIFGPTIDTTYHSFTSRAGNPTWVWRVNFFNGQAQFVIKTNNGQVRAVRGGR
jgi:hypothetical protein